MGVAYSRTSNEANAASSGVWQRIASEGFWYGELRDLLPQYSRVTLEQNLPMEHVRPLMRRVTHDGIHIMTANGTSLVSNFPYVSQLYLELQSYLHSSGACLHPLEDLQLAVSINKLASGDSFRPHFDRNYLTAVVYLSDSAACPLLLYPLIRPEPRDHGRIDFDTQDHSAIAIEPRWGWVLFFLGRRCLHGIETVEADAARYSIQLAYDDVPHADFEGEEYYGRF